MSTRPSWYDAPEWANYLAQDSDGRWCWYEEKPTKGTVIWSAGSGRFDYADEYADGWQDSLERRP